MKSIRVIALEKAVDMCPIEATSSEVIATAEKFYEFLMVDPYGQGR